MSQPIDVLLRRLKDLDGKSYGAYKSVKGRYQYPDFELEIDYIQGDPFAQPSKVRVFVPLEKAGFPAKLLQSAPRAVALRDQIARKFCEVAARHSKIVGSGKGGLLLMDRPGQQVLTRTAVLTDNTAIEARFLVGFPANGRRIMGHAAADIFRDKVPDMVRRSLLWASHDPDTLEQACLVNEDANALRSQLDAAGLVAFVADGSHLPRASGIDDRPLSDNAEPFQSPETFRIHLECPNRGMIGGMGVKKGVTLIVGGGYHGKSTLLRAIQMGVYNHIPGDGREYVVTDVSAVKIRSEDGRSVSGVCISPFIHNLPQQKDTDHFSTVNASGSTSQAASIVEAVQGGTKLLLLDEDTSATNFMIRDRRMQELIHKENEPITPFTDRIRQMYTEHQISTLLVMGGSGDYFELADNVIAMDRYHPVDVTDRAHSIAQEYSTGRKPEGGAQFGLLPRRLLDSACLNPERRGREVGIRTHGTTAIELGKLKIDLSHVEQLVDGSQLRAIAWQLVHFYREQNSALDLGNLSKLGDNLAALSDGPDGDLAEFRLCELLACINRIRELKIAAND